MKKQENTIKEWLKNYNLGNYKNTNTKTQLTAGWVDWFCFNDELPTRLEKISAFLNAIKNSSKITDDLQVSLQNHCSPDGKLYDSIILSPAYVIYIDYKYPITVLKVSDNKDRPVFTGTKSKAIEWFNNK